jgi:hypothetical protein
VIGAHVRQQLLQQLAFSPSTEQAGLRIPVRADCANGIRPRIAAGNEVGIVSWTSLSAVAPGVSAEAEWPYAGRVLGQLGLDDLTLTFERWTVR